MSLLRARSPGAVFPGSWGGLRLILVLSLLLLILDTCRAGSTQLSGADERISPQQFLKNLSVDVGERLGRAIARAWPDSPEPVAMLADILQGSRLGPGEGWFKKAVAQTRYDWTSTVSRLDRDADGRIGRDEFRGSDSDFDRLDRDHDGALGPPDFDFSAHALTPSPAAMLFYSADRDGNGKLTREEFDAFFKAIDSDGAGFLSRSDLQEALPRPGRAGSSSSGSQGPSVWTLLKGLARQEIGSLQPGPALGEPAPDFSLKTVGGEQDVTLSKLVGPRPVVLVFGNFTCGPFRSQAGNVEKLYRRYRDRATFVMVYVREAHPLGGWQLESNNRLGVKLAQPRSYQERVEVARMCGNRLGLGMPMLVDTLEDTVGARYSGMPSRLYLLDRRGRVAYKSGRGPFGFKPAELEHSLILLLRDEFSDSGREVKPPSSARVSPPPIKEVVPISSVEEAWRSLPRAEQGGGQPLPAWARYLARSLPRTTAAMLDLDRLHRTRSPLGPILRGKMRWVAADANRCAYSRAYAEADLRRAGASEADLKALAGSDLTRSSPEERAALEFARKMTLAANTVTDEDVRRLMYWYGPERVVAMVLLLAYSNFQDRLVLGLDLAVEPGGPLPPLEVRFARDAKPPRVPPRVRPPGSAVPAPPPQRVDDPEWYALGFGDLQKNLELQRSNAGRIRVPTWDEVRTRYPAGYPVPKNPVRIQWSLVCMGYQPELAAAWSACTRSFGEDAKQDRVFEESLFWVVTRTIDCFY